MLLIGRMWRGFSRQFAYFSPPETKSGTVFTTKYSTARVNNYIKLLLGRFQFYSVVKVITNSN